jgi:hypothetical protein
LARHFGVNENESYYFYIGKLIDVEKNRTHHGLDVKGAYSNQYLHIGKHASYSKSSGSPEPKAKTRLKQTLGLVPQLLGKLVSL